MTIALLIATFVFIFVFLFVFILLPLISMIECAVSNQNSGGKKAIWIIAHLMFWAIAGLPYCLFATHSRRLRGVTIKSLVAMFLCLGTIVGIGFANPEISEQMRQQLSALPMVAETGDGEIDFGFDAQDVQTMAADSDDSIDISNTAFIDPSGSGVGDDVQGMMLRSQAMMAMWSGNLDDAKQLIDQAIESDPHSIQLRATRAQIHHKAGDVHAAEEEWGELLAQLTGRIAFEPDSAKLYQQRSMCFESKEEYAAAIADMKKAIALDPNNESYRRELELLEINGKIGGKLSQESRPKPSSPLPEQPPVEMPQVKKSPTKRKPLPPPSIQYQKNLRENPFVK